MGHRSRAGMALLCFAFALPSAAGADEPAGASPPPPPPAVRAWQTGVLRADRLEHVSFSFTLGLGLGLLTRRPAGAAAGTLGLGLVKELRDRRHGGFDPVDLAADALGAGLAAAATHALRR